MITGYNTDVRHGEVVFHVQTEDKGISNPFIESLVYVGGQVLASKRASYAEMIAEGKEDKEIVALMDHQHRTMIAAIRHGKLDAKLASLIASRQTGAMPVVPGDAADRHAAGRPARGRPCRSSAAAAPPAQMPQVQPPPPPRRPSRRRRDGRARVVAGETVARSAARRLLPRPLTPETPMEPIAVAAARGRRRPSGRSTR